MRKSRFTEEQIISIPQESTAGAKMAELLRRHGISAPTFYTWRRKYGGLQVPDAKRLRALEDENRRRKRVVVGRLSAIGQQPNERWSMEFMSDTLGDGRTFRIFTLVDDCSRESPGLLVDFSLGAERVTRFLDTLEDLPTDLVCDNGPEFTSQHFDQWA